MKKGFFISPSEDPYENQSIEAYLFHEMKTYDVILMVYVNKPSVVIGRNQNPWTEVNPGVKIPVLRRLSGGGTVYHDLGNLNFSFIYNHGFSDVKENFNTVISAVRALGIELYVNDRNDLCYKNYKISGNAFYNKGKRHMHHGTLLIDTDFSDLWKFLRFDKKDFSTRSVASVKSDVMNLKKINKEVSVNNLIKQLEIQHQGESMKVTCDLDETYKTWGWVYGQTPQFKYRGDHDLTVKAGRIIEINGIKQEKREPFILY